MGRPCANTGQRTGWTVRVGDEHGLWSDWAESAFCTVPPLCDAGWSGRWIAVAATAAARRGFSLPLTGPVVVRATLHFAAQGLGRFALDGAWINADARDPSDTARTRVVSRSYDVTAELAAGDVTHVLAVVVGLGHYRQVLDTTRLVAELVMEHTDGSTTRIVTDEQWSTGPTSLTIEDPFYAEA